MEEKTYRWVKASERLPEKEAKYFARHIANESKCFLWLSDIKQAPYVYEWLEEIPSSKQGDGDKDADDVWDEVIHVFNITESPFLIEALKSKFNINRK